MTPQLLEAMGRSYRLRHTVQRRVEYALAIVIFAGLLAVIQHHTAQDIKPLTYGTLAVAVVMAASAWPVVMAQQNAERKVRWLRGQEDRSTRILPDAPDPLDTMTPRSGPAAV